MTSDEILRLVIYTVTVGCGWSLIGYAGYARLRGWPVGALLVSDFSWLQGLAWFVIITGVVLSVLAGRWWHTLVVIAGAIIFARVLLRALGPRSQIVASIGMTLGSVFVLVLAWP